MVARIAARPCLGVARELIRADPMDHKGFRSDSESDPVAELARLIGQSARYVGKAPVETNFRGKVDWDELPQLPPASQLPDPNAHKQEDGFGDAPDGDGNDQADEQACISNQDHRYKARRRLSRLTFLMAISGLALVGSAGVFGYRTSFVGSLAPAAPQAINKSNEPKSNRAALTKAQSNGGKEIRYDTVTTGSIENSGSRELRSDRVAVAKSIPAAADPVASPPSVAALSKRPGRSRSERLAVAPAAVDARNLTSFVSGAGYAVQVSSERSERRAQSVLVSLQAKFPSQLGGRRAVIRRADLGAAGIYYRALVGPFGSAKEAGMLCSALKTAGGDCVIQKN